MPVSVSIIPGLGSRKTTGLDLEASGLDYITVVNHMNAFKTILFDLSKILINLFRFTRQKSKGKAHSIIKIKSKDILHSITKKQHKTVSITSNPA